MSVTGILGKKIGMTQVFDDKGEVHPVTVLQAGPCVVTQLKTLAGDGYSAAQIGLIEFVKGGKVNKPMAGHFAKNNVPPVKLIREVPLEERLRGGESRSGTQGGRQGPGRYFRGREVRRCDRHQQGPRFRRRGSPPHSAVAPSPTDTCSRCKVRSERPPFRRASFPGSVCRGISARPGHGAQFAHSRHRPRGEPVHGRRRGAWAA